MNRFPSILAASLLLAVAMPAWAQQLQRPASTPQPAAQPAPATTRTPIPGNPSQRANPPGGIPVTGPSSPTRPAPTVQPVESTPVTPVQVRDAQGRIVPRAQQTTPGRARDPATGREFQTAPVPTRPR